MAAVGWNEKGIAGGEMDGFAGFEAEFRLALEQQHPFGAVLVIPEAIRAGRTAGDDVFQSERGMLDQSGDGFRTGFSSGKIEEIGDGFHEGGLGGGLTN